MLKLRCDFRYHLLNVIKCEDSSQPQAWITITDSKPRGHLVRVIGHAKSEFGHTNDYHDREN